MKLLSSVEELRKMNRHSQTTNEREMNVIKLHKPPPSKAGATDSITNEHRVFLSI